ncbi:glycosyltransferase family 2 protein [Pseudodesulfovibrio indicus]|uniref:Glycosyl transferase family 2 n=1 Tax=Pseudodesulfovibrio indicus TaxID=1716143 RepID=A0A140D949_9BACT|nr:glycosyltransferase [Pseudodesulfovibrio indicus]AMK09716.1 glycosyl transferase family 2 [Pseudodesulfovibrio indicus]TDT81339.1 hypothetical protein EDC59_1215 [Pseudodesulfovibrio indicus]
MPGPAHPVPSLAAFRRGLPEEIRVALRLGFTGKTQLLDVAGRCLRAGRDDLLPTAGAALGKVVSERPLDGGLAGELLSLEAARSLLDPQTAARLRTVADHWRRPDGPSGVAGFLELMAERDFERIGAFLTRAMKDEPGNLFWREQAVTVGTVWNDPAFVFRALEGGPDAVAAPLSEALALARACFDPPAKPDAETLLLGARTAPWDTNLLLRAHDAACGLADRRAPLDGTVAVLLYSWNKADELDETLGSLLASDLAGASIFVLDNGSTDRTPELLARWRPHFADTLGEGRYTVVSLPVNIGAAAARNWLLHLDAVRAHDFICYLDDDVELPADWLPRFGAAVERYPEAGVWGCKVVDHANPLLIQSADGHLLLDPAERADLTRMAPNPFRLSDLHIQTLDRGDFDYMRPCASVTGCCHLFRTPTLLDSGDFAIQLSPSQYDDLEHDLRLCESGRFPVHQGHLAVRHKKRTGMASHTSPQQEGNALGNKYKMQTMHDRSGLAAAMRAEQALLEADLLAKLDYLDSL